MLDEVKKSIQSILSQRAHSPFYGTLIVSWLLWNWRIVYLTLFVSEKYISVNKIDFIIGNYCDINYLIWYPISSTLVILTIMPFLTNAAFWLELKFDKWRIDKKQEIEGKKILTLEQSISLREQILKMESNFEELMKNKDAEILQLRNYITKIENASSSNSLRESERGDMEVDLLADKILNNNTLLKGHKTISIYIQGGYSSLVQAEGMNPELLNFFESNKLIESTKPGFFKWTERGISVNKLIAEKQF